jgi:hypothetical protein
MLGKIRRPQEFPAVIPGGRLDTESARISREMAQARATQECLLADVHGHREWRHAAGCHSRKMAFNPQANPFLT